MGAAESDHEGAQGMPPVVVPDDASTLEPDRRAWLAEERTKRRRARLRRMIFTRRWERFGLSGPLVVIALMITSIFGGFAVFLLPRQQRFVTAPPAPLSGDPEVLVGSTAPPVVESTGGGVLGRRIPPMTLEGDVRTVAVANLRPAVLMIVPADCPCTASVKEIFRQAREYSLDVWLVGEKGPDETAAAPARNRLIVLDEQGTGGGARWAVDSTGFLAKTLVARGLTMVAVRADGDVAGLRRDLPLEPAHLPVLDGLLATLIMRSG